MTPRSWLSWGRRAVIPLLADVPDGRTLTLAVPAEVSGTPPVLRLVGRRASVEHVLMPGPGSPARWQAVIDLDALLPPGEGHWTAVLVIGHRVHRLHQRAGAEPPRPAPAPLTAAHAFVLDRGRRDELVVRRTRVQPSVLVSSIQHAPGHLLLRLDGSEGSVLEVVSVRFQHARSARHVTVRPRRRGEAWELRVPVKALMAVAGAPSAWTISSVEGDTIVPVRMRGLRSEAGVRRTWMWMPHVDGAAAYRVRPRLGLDGVVQVTVTRVEK